jgi:hypothetical protein
MLFNLNRNSKLHIFRDAIIHGKGMNLSQRSKSYLPGLEFFGQINTWINHKTTECQGFTKSHSGLGQKGLKEYLDSYLVSDYLGPVLGSK